ncbi:MAG TPA: hypothetical protein VJW16_05160 [Lysobacter sp.]|nr:hypothetical protein [Lysobacter sp.]
MRSLPLIAIAATAVLALTACGKSAGERAAEAAIEASTGQKADVDAKNGAVTIKTDKGEMKMTSGDTAALPASFPKDVYLPEHYAVKSAMEMPNAMVLEIEAPGAVATLAADASKRMQAQGWKQQMAMAQTGQSQVLVYEKEKRSATLSFNDNAGKGVTLGVQVATNQQ